MSTAATAATAETTGPPPRNTPTAADMTAQATVTAHRGSTWPRDTIVAIRERAR
jgi:hypothetical protein